MTIKTALGCCVLVLSLTVFSSDLDKIMASHDKKVASAQKSYDKKVDGIMKETIRRLETLKDFKTRAGKLDEAVAIRDQIDVLKGKEGAAIAKKKAPARETISEKQTKKLVSRRYVQFHQAMIKNDMDKALEFVDPNMRRALDRNVLLGYLKITAGMLQAFKITEDGVDVERMTLTDDLKTAKIIGKHRVGRGRWNENKDPSYWVFRRGEWYLGDDKELRKEFD